MGQAQVPAKPRLYRRQWFQPLAQRRTGGKNHLARGRHRSLGREAKGAGNVARARGRFPELGAAAANQREGARANERAPLPPVARRGSGRNGGGPRQSAGFEGRLAEAPFSGRERRTIRRWLCPGRNFRPPDGKGLRHFAQGRCRTGGDPTAKDEHADRHGAQPSDPGRSQSAIAENLARHADPRPRRSGLVNTQQGQARGMALFL